MICPNCKSNLHKVKISSVNKGFFIQLDQCHKCGGIWRDRYEAYQIPAKEAQKIEDLDIDLVKRDTIINKQLTCPKDNFLLKQIKGPVIPEFLKISRCNKCQGIWFNEGKLKKYRQHFANKNWAQKEKKKWKDIKDDSGLIINSLGKQMIPFSASSKGALLGYMLSSKKNIDRPFILTSAGVDLLRKVPQKEKVELCRTMAQKHNQTVASEKRFINSTLRVLEIIFYLLRMGIKF